MPRRWSRAVGVLCVVYLVVVVLFHRQLGPFSQHQTGVRVMEQRDLHSVTRPTTNGTGKTAHRPQSLTQQLQELEVGMTQLEKEIAEVKLKLATEMAQPSARRNGRGEHGLRQDTVLHHRQSQQPPPQQRSHTQHRVSAERPPVVQHRLHIQMQPLLPNPVPEDQDPGQPVRRLRQQEPERLHRQSVNTDMPETFLLHPRGILGPPLDASQGEGGGLPLVEDYTNSSLVKIDEGVAVYSAYHDDRIPSKPSVRLIMIVSAPKPNRRVLCHFHTATLVSVVEAEQYELCENHKKRYLGFIYSCRVPGELGSVPYKLFLSPHHKPTSLVPLPVIRVSPPNIATGKVSEEKHQYKYNYSVCVSPLFGSVLAKRLVEFLELSRLLGTQHVFFYDFQLSSVIRRVLRFYQDKGWVTVLPWRLPVAMNNARIWYHGQLVTNNDCLYRTMALSAFTAFHDIDEFIVPHAPDVRTVPELLGPSLPNDTCGYSFSSAFYDPGISRNNFPDDLMTVSLTAKSSMLSKIRTKVLVAPRRVFEVGIHHISKQLREHWSPRRYDSGKAILHHYRQCIRDYGMRCENWVKDTIIRDKYMPQLKVNVWEVIRTLKL